MQSQTPCWGADCHKETVVLAVDGQSEVTTLANRVKELKRWLAGLPGPVAIAMESSGRFHVTLANLAYKMGHAVFVLDPKRVRRYAQCTAFRGKTDRIDACVMARFLAREQAGLRRYVPPTPEQRRIDSLLRRRHKLDVIRQQLADVEKLLHGNRAQMRRVRDDLKDLIRAVDRSLKALITRDPALAERYQRLRRLPGIGPLNGTALTNLFHRIDFRAADPVVAFVGLDPRPHDSGQHRGKRRLTKHGHPEYRRLLHNAAMSARKTAIWKPYYERSLKRGLATTEALVELSRRILRVAWAIDHHQREFDPGRLRVG